MSIMNLGLGPGTNNGSSGPGPRHPLGLHIITSKIRTKPRARNEPWFCANFRTKGRSLLNQIQDDDPTDDPSDDPNGDSYGESVIGWIDWVV